MPLPTAHQFLGEQVRDLQAKARQLIEGALSLARVYVQLEYPDAGPAAREEDALARLMAWSRMYADRPGYPTTADMLMFSIDHGASDGVLVYCVSSPAKYKWPGIRPSVCEVLEKADPTGERFPMTLAVSDLRSAQIPEPVGEQVITRAASSICWPP
jgi:hypothetical protein